jgi:hypothetical protein
MCAPKRLTEVDAGLERIKHLEEQLAPALVNGRQRRGSMAAIRIEAEVYRKSHDTEQARATYDPKPQFADGSGSLNRIAGFRNRPSSPAAAFSAAALRTPALTQDGDVSGRHPRSRTAIRS